MTTFELTDEQHAEIRDEEYAENSRSYFCQECGEYWEHEHWHAEVADSGSPQRSEAADRLINYFGL